MIKNDNTPMPMPLHERLYRLKTAVNEAKAELEHEIAIHERELRYIAKTVMILNPFEFDLTDYILLQGKNIFTEKWEKRIALSMMQGAIDWKNKEYKKQKAKYDRAKTKCEKHAEKIRVLRKRISHLNERIRKFQEST